MSTGLEHPRQDRVEHGRPATRSPLWSAVLSALTFSVFGWWWWWKLNNELCSSAEDIRPWGALAAVTVGWALVVPPFYAVRRTTERIADYQEQAGLAPTASPQTALGILVALASSLVLFFVSLWLPTGDFLLIPLVFVFALVSYEQRELNLAVAWKRQQALAPMLLSRP
jgi:hypothetical protein